MDLLKQLMAGRSEELMSALSGAGFSPEQAGEFLPQAADGIGEALGKVDLGALLQNSSDPVSGIMQHMDLGAMAQKLGFDQSMISNGLSAILPQILAALQGEKGGLSSLLGELGSAGGGIGGLLKRGAGFFK